MSIIDRAVEFICGASSQTAIDRRWRAINATKRAEGCPCGKPAAHVTRYPTAGTVPFEWWTCDEHAGANGFSTTQKDGELKMTAWWNRATPCDGCGITQLCHGHTSDIKSGKITAYSCPVPPSEAP